MSPPSPLEVLKDFLYLGGYSQASRSEVLKTLGFSHILNTLHDCKNVFTTSFTYHILQRDKPLDFDKANQILEECERNKSRVLVHCMSGKNRSAAFVAAFLIKSRGWRLAQCFQWVKDRRPQNDIRPLRDARQADAPDLREAKKKAVAVPYNGED
ncbi:hypothetical protein PR202_gb09589 [Eleusine coracana subsp. coracana]|uniref:Tyrosine specific protein phosphatases domain-containing protein n=1 Tax=Eleusine coracana subsp. coracana TaxID=191504 RepID=A0AAV5EI68_ELECO|nr:hypothetical protein PR202_gb09589 [Eleusine coracana subsp. coracana]